MIAFPRLALALTLFGVVPAFAQTKASTGAAKTPPGLTISAANSTASRTGIRFEGVPGKPARVASSQIDVSGQVIALDLSAKDNAITQVRAQNSVNLKLDLPSRNGSEPAHIEVKCSNATLTPKPFKLVLNGNLNGFYQIAGGAKNTLKGKTATFTEVNKQIIADLTGGITLTIPAETLKRPDDLGDVTITAQSGRINQADGTATFTGNARAVSKGANAFDVSATEFVLTRAADGTIATLKTSGRTLIKLDLPPDPIPATETVTADGTNGKPAIGKPTHVEVAADGAVIERASSTATFNGNVKGFYLLSPAGGVAQPYNFAGDKAIIRYVPQTGTAPGGNLALGLNVQVSGSVAIEGPPLDFAF